MPGPSKPRTTGLRPRLWDLPVDRQAVAALREMQNIHPVE